MREDSRIPAFSLSSWLVRLACVLLLAGQAWLHMDVGDIPLRELLWNEEMMTGIVHKRLGMTWNEYVTSPEIDRGISRIIFGMGVFYAVAALFALVLRPRTVAATVLCAATVLLVFLAWLEYLDQARQWTVFWEHALQSATPLLVVLLCILERRGWGMQALLRLALAVTFIAHGVFAWGLSPEHPLPWIGHLGFDVATPGSFVEMTLESLDLETEEEALQILHWAGLADFIAAILLFLPKLWILGAAYMTAWGFLTALARLWTYFESEVWAETLRTWGPEFLVRGVHWLVPLALLVLWRERVAQERRSGLLRD
ncbi:MAG TPA: hypothetical protein VMN36_04310 [Verrucomicrobiales bacterium]|nr:hypothetical protein [Verrucomicrobiales bacterium]